MRAFILSLLLGIAFAYPTTAAPPGLGCEVFHWNLELHPDSWRAYHYLGEAHAQAGDTPKAIRRFERSLKLNPDHPFVTGRLDAMRG